jgi:hypothetical protein
MATYLQGVTDYIPEFQPFQPDLNFYSNLMQVKQTQYDTNWKAINKIYGQYFYSDLSRKDNMEIKDELMKNIDFNLKRISGLDLSLEQNVEQAAQVFKPFYEDKFLMKDMAYTKNYQNQRNRGTSLKNAKEAEERAQYWDTGIKALDYQREEFRNVSREESLNIGSTTYTPYVNAIDKYAKIAKEWGISADITSPDASGLYMVRQKNGDLVLPTLQTLFEAYGSNDPQLQDVYFTQSYVNRKDYVYQHANDFGGDMNAAERDYITQATKTVSDYVARKAADYEKQNNAIKNEGRRTTDMVEKNEDNLFTNSYIDRLNEAAGYTEAAAANAEKLNNDINDSSVTDVTSGGSYDTSEDIETLRRKVDSGIASMLMDADISKAAYTYSRKDMKYEMSENQYGLESVRQQNRLAAIAAKGKQDEWNIKLEHNLKEGLWLLDESGNVYPKDLNFFNPNPVSATDPSNPELEEEEKKDVLDENKFAMDEVARVYSKDWVESAHNLVEKAYEKGIISKQEYGKFFSLDWSEENYASAKEAGRDVFNKAAGKTVSTGKGILSKLVKGWGIDQRVAQVLGNDAAKTMTDWLDKEETPKPKNFADKKNDGTVTKILDMIGVTDAIGKLYYQTPGDFYTDYKKDPASFLYGQAESIGLIKSKVDGLAGMLRGDGDIGDNYIIDTARSGQQMDKFIMHANAVRAINMHNTDVVQNALKADIMMYNIAKNDDSLTSRLANSFYDGSSVSSKEDFVRNGEAILRNIQARPMSTRGYGWVDKGMNSLTEQEQFKLNNILNQANKKTGRIQEGAIPYSDKLNNLTGREVADIKRTFIANTFNLDPTTGAPDKSKTLERLYDSMFSSYTKTVQDPSKVQILTPLLDAVTKSGGRAGVYSRGESGVEVHLGAPSSFKPFAEFIQSDLRNIRFGDVNNTAISVLGTTKGAFDKAKTLASEDGGAERDMLLRIINDLYTDIRQGSKTKPFKFTQRQIAGERRDLGAMVLYPDLETLNKYKAGKDEPGLSAETINNAMRYGISVMAPRQNFNNSLFTQNFWTPMQIAVKGSPSKSLTLSNPFGAGKVKVSEVKMGPGDYSVEFTSNELKPDGTIRTITTNLPNIMYGNNIDIQAQEAMDQLMIVTAQNNSIYQTLSPELKRKVSQSGVFKNVPVSMQPLVQGAWDVKRLQQMALSR